MVKKNVMLSEKVAEQILKMITIEKKFNIGDKLPNETELSEELAAKPYNFERSRKISYCAQCS